METSVLTVGNFDGFHRAHRKLLTIGRRLADAGGAPLVALTFEPHPLTIVAPDRTPPRLSTIDERIRRLADAGADVVVIARSEPSLLEMEPAHFIEEVLVRLFHPTHVVEGPSFGFGRNRTGTPELLRRVAAPFGVTTEIVEPLLMTLKDGGHVMISSSLIRRLVSAGSVTDASRALGRPYELSGAVVRGDARGAGIGFPTANVGDIPQLIPGDGVYAGYAVVDGDRYASAINVGPAPTFGGADRRVEAHLLDFDADIYGQPIRIGFAKRLRTQRSFGSPEELAAQLADDVREVRRFDASPVAREAWNKAEAS